MNKWETIQIENLHSSWSADLTTIYLPEEKFLVYNVLMSDKQDHVQAIFAPENLLGTFYEDGFIHQRSTTHILFLLARKFELTRIKLQFFDETDFLVQEFHIPCFRAVAEASALTEKGVITFPAKYESEGILGREPLKASATSWGLFLPDSMD